MHPSSTFCLVSQLSCWCTWTTHILYVLLEVFFWLSACRFWQVCLSFSMVLLVRGPLPHALGLVQHDIACERCARTQVTCLHTYIFIVKRTVQLHSFIRAGSTQHVSMSPICILLLIIQQYKPTTQNSKLKTTTQRMNSTCDDVKRTSTSEHLRPYSS